MTQNDSPKDPIQDLTDMMLDVQRHVQGAARKQERMEGRMDRMESRMDRLENNQQQVLSELNELRQKSDRVLDLLDGIASRIIDDDTERMALSAQVTRHEDWIIDAAPAIDVSYTPGA
ncbi:hypothetical protein GCM10027414_04830 [Humibacter ginsengiterrae]